MARIELTTDGPPQIEIKAIGGSLQVKGHSEETVRIDVQDQKSLEYRVDGDMVYLSAAADCVLRVPEEASLRVQRVGRDAHISHIEGDVAIEQVGGSLVLRNVGPTTAGQVAGSLTARTVEGDLSVREVAGNATFRNIEGELEALGVHANLVIREAEGSILARSHGNAELRLTAVEGDINIEVAGNLFCDLLDSVDANFRLESNANTILINTAEQKSRLQSRTHDLVVGEGGTEVILKANGVVDLRTRDGDDEIFVDLGIVDDLDNLAEEITGQVTQQIEGQMEALNRQLNSLTERLSHSGAKAASKAQERVARAQRKLELKLAKRQGRRGPGPGTAGKATEPVASQERAMVLNMLQDKKISIDEAELLLHALEGRSAPEAPTPPVPPQPPEPPVAPAAPAQEDQDAQ